MDSDRNWFSQHQGWSIVGTVIAIMAATAGATAWVYEETRVHNLKTELSRQLGSLTSRCESVGLLPSTDDQKAALSSCQAENSNLSDRLKQHSQNEQVSKSELSRLKGENTRLTAISNKAAECQRQVAVLQNAQAESFPSTDDVTADKNCSSTGLAGSTLDGSFSVIEGNVYIDENTSLIIAATKVGGNYAHLKITLPGRSTLTQFSSKVGDTWTYASDGLNFTLILVSIQGTARQCSFAVRKAF